MAGRRRKRRGGKLLVAAIVFAAVFFLFGRGPDRDQGPLELEKGLRDWAKGRSLVERTDRARRIEVEDWPSRRVIVERAYWFGPSTSVEDLCGELGDLALSLGLEPTKASGPRGGAAVSMCFRDGTDAARVTLWRGAYAAIVMDDMGYGMRIARRALALPCRMTLAVLPFTPHAREIAGMATPRGKEVYVHMPMESIMPLPDVPEFRFSIRPGQESFEIRDVVTACLSEIPNATGLNNHEGSLATQDSPLMYRLMSVMKERGLVFMDSVTSVRSIAWLAAARSGVRWQKRDFFLDDEPGGAAIRSYFRAFIAKAFKEGRAIAVCHPRKETLAVLEREIPEAVAQGVFFVPASSLARRRNVSSAAVSGVQ